jgi:hypothetical protein
MNFKEYIFGLLSPYLRNSDSYKDGNGQGIMERFLGVLGKYWDDNLKNKIDNARELYTVGYNSNKFISYIASVKGCIPQGNLDDVIYNRIVKNWISINKIKGTKLGYKYLIFLYNPDLEIDITENYATLSSRDMEPKRDNESSFRDYGCPPCTKYNIEISYLTEPSDMTKFEADIRYLISGIEPINCKLDTLTFTLLLTPYRQNQDLINLSSNQEALSIKVNGLVVESSTGDFLDYIQEEEVITGPPDVIQE